MQCVDDRQRDARPVHEGRPVVGVSVEQVVLIGTRGDQIVDAREGTRKGRLGQVGEIGGPNGLARIGIRNGTEAPRREFGRVDPGRHDADTGDVRAVGGVEAHFMSPLCQASRQVIEQRLRAAQKRRSQRRDERRQKRDAHG